jgi:hypothetical protein
MLHEYLLANRAKVIERCRLKVALRSSPKAVQSELDHGVPQFLDQLVRILASEQVAHDGSTPRDAEHSRTAASMAITMAESAQHHGRDLLHEGFTIEQVVHDYGDICQAITDLAYEDHVAVEVNDFRTLNRCLDNAIAAAVSTFSSMRDASIVEMSIRAVAASKGPAKGPKSAVAGPLRDKLAIATAALAAIKTGRVGITGATGTILEKCLEDMTGLVAEAFPETIPSGAKTSPARRTDH